MSRFFTENLSELEPYTPGEQPQDQSYVKLNTNESPYIPSPEAKAIAAEHLRELNLYSDPECRLVADKLAEMKGVDRDNVVFGNGSDEILFFAFRAFCDEFTPALFPDISYGFYPVFARVNKVPYEEIPLREDFSIAVEDYASKNGTIFIANPNAPTGLMLRPAEIERLADAHPDNVVVVDEAYVDFGGESSVGLIRTHENILVVQTFSKSRSLAGARIGFAIGPKELIADLNTIKYSVNPYNINSMTQAMAYGVLCDDERVRANCAKIMDEREYLTRSLKELDFEVIDSKANFIFAKSHDIGGGELYSGLREKGVLVRHFTKERIKDYNRITIGTREQSEILLNKIKEILAESKGR